MPVIRRADAVLLGASTTWTRGRTASSPARVASGGPAVPEPASKAGCSMPRHIPTTFLAHRLDIELAPLKILNHVAFAGDRGGGPEGERCSSTTLARGGRCAATDGGEEHDSVAHDATV